MATTIGLRCLTLALTFCGFIQLILPHALNERVDRTKVLLIDHLTNLRLQRDNYLTRCRLRVFVTGRRGQYLLRLSKDYIINHISPPKSRLLRLPRELRDPIYHLLCTPRDDGSLPASLNVLLINKQIYSEAELVFNAIEHTITIGDLERFQFGTIEYMGTPRTIQIEGGLDWHMSSLKHLVLNLKVCKLSTMTLDCFDVYIAHNGKQQWRNLKRLIGIWPELRDTPLESVRIDLAMSEQAEFEKKYLADLIRVIRNFKRTKIWAETADGDCSKRGENRSVLLPLVKAFNQGRRNWDTESSADNNLLVRYDEHILSERAMDSNDEEAEERAEEVRLKWSVRPTNDTSRSANSVWPEWSGKEEQYISQKMIHRAREEGARDWECRECLAVFDKPKELKAHIARGKWRK